MNDSGKMTAKPANNNAIIAPNTQVSTRLELVRIRIPAKINGMITQIKGELIL
jgi:hypothetical protein